MTRTWINRGFVLLAALALCTQVRAQADCDFEFEDVCVELPNGIPVPGRDLQVRVTVDLPVTGTGSVFYRPTGSATYTEVVVQQNDGTYSVTIPGDAITVRGLDVYGAGMLVGDNEVFTYPEENPQDDPIRVPAFLSSFTIPRDLPVGAYEMIAISANAGTASVEDVLADDFGEVDPARWRLLRWNPPTQTYVAAGADDSFKNGAAFWLITANGGRFDIDVARTTNPDSLPAIRLVPGRNQIGNPYAFPVAWDDILAASGLSGGELGSPMAYDGQSPYVPVDVLEPWTGYFVENRTGEAISLTVPAREASLLRAPLGGDAARYAVRLAATSGAYRDTLNVVGFDAAASPGRDGLDLIEYPDANEHIRVSVLDGETRWMRSVKPFPAEGQVWDVEVTATEGLLASGTRRVTLDVAEFGRRPAGFGLYVIDRDRGNAVAFSGSTFEVSLDRDAPVRRLRVIAGTEGYARAGSEGAPLEPSAFALEAGYPNPFAAQTTLRYRLDARGPATLDVFDLLGRRVRVLVDGEVNAGPHVAEWDGRDAAGRLVANGVYLVRLRAGTASATRRVSVLR